MKAFYRLLYNISILLSCLLTGCTLAGAFSGKYDPEVSTLLPFIGLILPGLLLLNLAVAIYWTVRWRCWVIIPLIAIFGNWEYISATFQLPLFTSAAKPSVEVQSYTPGTLTIATYNVNNFNHEQTGFTSKSIAESMKNAFADILCFQEFGAHNEFNVDSLKATFAQWPYHYIPASPAGEHLLQLAVFSRYPIKNDSLITYPGSNNCSLRCDIDYQGRTIRLFNNHLQTTEVTRNKSKLMKEVKKEDTDKAEQLLVTLSNGLYENFKKRAEQATTINQLVAASPYPTLVCGDFNSLPSSFTYNTIKGEKLKDGFQTCGHGYMYTFHYFKRILRIDYAFHSAEFQGVDYFSPNLEHSDHNPVVMRVKI